MKLPFFALLATFFVVNIGQANADASVNCSWKAETSSGNFYAMDNLKSFQACSLFVRGALLGQQSEWLGDFGSSVIGDETWGSLTYREADGSDRICQTKLKKNPPSWLNTQEAHAVYLKSELDGGALTPDDQEKAKRLLRNLSIDVDSLIKKIDESIVLECTDFIS